MNIDPYMVNLFFEIKRNAPKEYQSTLSLSAPDLVDALTNLYKIHKDEAQNRLIEVFFERSGRKSLIKFKKAIKKKSISNPSEPNNIRDSRMTSNKSTSSLEARNYKGLG